MFRTVFENKSNTTQFIALTSVQPGAIMPFNLDEHPEGITFTRGTLLGSTDIAYRIDVSAVKSAGVACCGGQGIFLTTLVGKKFAFFSGNGTILERQLNDGEKLIVNSSKVLAFEKRVDFGLKMVDGGCLGCCCGGMGCFNSVLTGPGKVYLYTNPSTFFLFFSMEIDF